MTGAGTFDGFVRQSLRAIEAELDRLLPPADAPPRQLNAAMRHSVLNGGKRLRALLVLAVVNAHGRDQPPLAHASAAALEMIHAGSLIHDDLPCFDNADLRRGKPSCHKAFGEATALLAGDALFVLPFEIMARVHAPAEERLHAMRILAEAAGPARGIFAGQALESEQAPLEDIHAAKTASLFRAAAELGALAAGGGDLDRWARWGDVLGHAFQLMDDVLDAESGSITLGKPSGQDERNQKPSGVRLWGLAETRRRAEGRLGQALDLIPSELDGAILRELALRCVRRSF
ncbi:MAG: Farnesyl diphosphate synthase [Myxococcota bacterium]|nr:Farnesyl diphosphate synthase [Myxococcota bacterium]